MSAIPAAMAGSWAPTAVKRVRYREAEVGTKNKSAPSMSPAAMRAFMSFHTSMGSRMGNSILWT